jgi:hypothetical protein
MYLEFKEMIRIINYMCKYATFALQLLILLLFKWYVTKHSSRYMLTTQMSSSDSPNYAVQYQRRANSLSRISSIA